MLNALRSEHIFVFHSGKKYLIIDIVRQTQYQITRVFQREKMPKFLQNIVMLMEPPERPWNISLKAGNIYLNRFCIEEDAEIESFGVFYLEPESYDGRSTIIKGKV